MEKQMRYDGLTKIYDCPICKDKKYVYPRKENGQPDYAHVKKCICQTQQPEQLPLGEEK